MSSVRTLGIDPCGPIRPERRTAPHAGPGQRIRARPPATTHDERRQHMIVTHVALGNERGAARTRALLAGDTSARAV